MIAWGFSRYISTITIQLPHTVETAEAPLRFLRMFGLHRFALIVTAFGWDRALSGLILAVVAGFLLLPWTVQAADWPQFLGPTRNGVYAGADLAKSWPK